MPCVLVRLASFVIVSGNAESITIGQVRQEETGTLPDFPLDGADVQSDLIQTGLPSWKRSLGQRIAIVWEIVRIAEHGTPPCFTQRILEDLPVLIGYWMIVNEREELRPVDRRSWDQELDVTRMWVLNNMDLIAFQPNAIWQLDYLATSFETDLGFLPPVIDATPPSGTQNPIVGLR